MSTAQTGTILQNGPLFLLIGEQGQLHYQAGTRNEVIRLATKYNIRLINERGPKHQEYITRFNAKFATK